MGICIDIVNFILVFLLVDFINGIHDNYLAQKMKSGALSIVSIIFIALFFSLVASLAFATKIALLVIIVLVYLAIFLFYTHIKKLQGYVDVECGKDDFFSKQKVMILVPHEDDDINLMGGVIEEYIKHRSDVYVVFATNGDGDKRYDMSKMGFIRMNEAIKALALFGVPEDNIIFLGYGDGWGDKSPHIYNSRPDDVVKSTSGRTSTYGLESHPPFHDGRSYTYAHYYDDIVQVMLEHKPDVIFCIDYDTHNDHRALSMLFEKAMGNILKTTDYKPTVYKGYGYRTAWGAKSDFSDTINITSTVNCPSYKDVELYNWDKRVRLPINIGSVNRRLQCSILYSALSEYASQRAIESADRIINGDKVFWQRRTDSLLYNAEISVSSGDKTKLTDFLLLDCDDLVQHGDRPFDGVWRPDEDDNEKSIYVALDKKIYIDNIVLYDNPSPNDNVLNAVVSLDDGTIIETGKLNSHGDATLVSINKMIHSFSIKIDKYEGDNFGLSEIEAYCSPSQETPLFHKLTNDQGDFVYDYIVPEDGIQVLKIYSNYDKNIDVDSFSLQCNNKKCAVSFCDGKIIAECPVGKICKITLLDQDDRPIDRVVLRNPIRIERHYLCKSQRIKNCSYFKRAVNFLKNKIYLMR